jgi:hypothetical protein
MAIIVDKLPFSDRVTSVDVQGQSHRVFPNQILVWASLAPVGTLPFDPRTPRFPAVIDTGFTDNFLIHAQQLRDFAGLETVSLTRYSEDLRAHGRRIPIRAANLWIHRNRRAERDTLAGTEPFLLELDRGIGVTGEADGFPRLPLLGARALRQVHAQLLIDCWKCQVSLTTPRRFRFLRWRQS